MGVGVGVPVTFESRAEIGVRSIDRSFGAG
jgi:hypothetical protein